MMHLFNKVNRIAQGREMKMIKLKYWHIQCNNIDLTFVIFCNFKRPGSLDDFKAKEHCMF